MPHPTTESTRQPDQSASSAPKGTPPSGDRPAVAWGLPFSPGTGPHNQGSSPRSSRRRACAARRSSVPSPRGDTAHTRRRGWTAGCYEGCGRGGGPRRRVRGRIARTLGAVRCRRRGSCATGSRRRRGRHWRSASRWCDDRGSSRDRRRCWSSTASNKDAGSFGARVGAYGDLERVLGSRRGVRAARLDALLTHMLATIGGIGTAARSPNRSCL